MLAAAPGYPTLAALQTSCKGMRVIPALATAPNGFLEPITAIPAYLATHIFLPGLRSRQGGSGILRGEALPFLSCLFYLYLLFFRIFTSSLLYRAVSDM